MDPQTIQRCTSRGDDEVPELDLMQNMLKYCRILKAVPISDRLKGAMDLVALESVVSGLMHEIQATPDPAGGLYFRHESGNVELPLQDLREIMMRESSGEEAFITLPVEEWARKARQEGMHEILAAFFENLGRLEKVVTFPRLVKDSPR